MAASFYEALASNIEIHTRRGAQAQAVGAGPGLAVIERMRDAAAASRGRAAVYRAAAYRPWIALPAEPSLEKSDQPILPCPDDDTSEPPHERDEPTSRTALEPSPGAGPAGPGRTPLP